LEEINKDYVEAHTQRETADIDELLPGHINRKKASQVEFDKAKKFLTELYGGKRCIVCEIRGENHLDHHPENHIESHHVFEWSHWNDNDMEMVEVTLRALSPFIHGLYILTADAYRNGGYAAVRPALFNIVNSGTDIPTLWKIVTDKFDSLDDPRNQLFLCHAHHQQATKDEINGGYDIIGLHHMFWTLWLQYMGMPSGKVPALHHAEQHHVDGLNRKV
jgi:hypothetical protein